MWTLGLKALHKYVDEYATYVIEHDFAYGTRVEALHYVFRNPAG